MFLVNRRNLGLPSSFKKLRGKRVAVGLNTNFYIIFIREVIFKNFIGGAIKQVTAGQEVKVGGYTVVATFRPIRKN